MSLCHSVTLSLCHCVTLSLCYCAIHPVAVALCHCVTVLLYHCVTVPLCHCMTVSLCHSITVLLCHSPCHCITVALCASSRTHPNTPTPKRTNRRDLEFILRQEAKRKCFVVGAVAAAGGEIGHIAGRSPFGPTWFNKTCIKLLKIN